MDKFELMERTRRFAVRVYKLVNKFPKTQGAKVISNQLLKSSSSEAANYRAACRGKSRADFINKMKIVEEEADESLFWLQFIKDVELMKDDEELDSLIKEADELVAIFTKSLKTLKS
jgi:four helix bundle protein